jgi:hypothetical protein
MNILLWVLQILLALHTIVGAVWKFSNSEQTVPSLQTIPHGIWLAMSIIELLCALALILPALKKRLPLSRRPASPQKCCSFADWMSFQVTRITATSSIGLLWLS